MEFNANFIFMHQDTLSSTIIFAVMKGVTSFHSVPVLMEQL